METKKLITLEVNNLNEKQMGVLENALMRGLAKEVKSNSSLREIIGGDNALWIEAGWDNGNSWIEAGWDNAGKSSIIDPDDITTQIGKVEVSNLRNVNVKIDDSINLGKIRRFKNIRKD